MPARDTGSGDPVARSGERSSANHFIAAAPARRAEDFVTSFEQWVQIRSSLQGAEMDGDWGMLDRQGNLTPGRSIRHRFDQLLTLQGEVELNEISAYVEAASLATLGDKGGRQSSDLWNRYLALLARSYKNSVSLTDANGWEAALHERRLARREALGPEWAEAFFGDDEREFEALIQQVAPTR